jgi:hypothetical protein
VREMRTGSAAGVGYLVWGAMVVLTIPSAFLAPQSTVTRHHARSPRGGYRDEGRGGLQPAPHLRLRGGAGDKRGGPQWDPSMLSREIPFPARELTDAECAMADRMDRVERESELGGFRLLANKTRQDLLAPEYDFKIMDEDGNLHDLNGMSTEKLKELGDEEDWYTHAGCMRKMDEIALMRQREAERDEARSLSRRHAEIQRGMLLQERRSLLAHELSAAASEDASHEINGVVTIPGTGITATYHNRVVDSDSEAVPEGPHLGQLAVDMSKLQVTPKGRTNKGKNKAPVVR